jgi:hypothetical protein
MAESDGKPASSPLSSDEADRLSEKFRPSWEPEPDAPTLPKAAPQALPDPGSSAESTGTPPAVSAPAVSAPAVSAPASVTTAPAMTKAPAPTGPSPVKLQPAVTVSIGPSKPADSPAKPHALKQTLLGVAVPLPSAPPPDPRPSNPPDDLDWEPPVARATDIAQEAQPIEPPPKSNPSGIGQKYEPKDTGAPPIVLTDDVKRAEERARAQLAAEHRARSAPTLLKVKAIDVQPKLVLDDETPDFAPSRKGLGLWIGLGAAAAAVVLGVVVLSRGKSDPAPEPVTETAAASRTVSPIPPPPPPAVTNEPPTEPSKPAAPATTPEPTSKPALPLSKATATTKTPKTVSPSTKVSQPKPAQTTSTTTSPGAKPAPKPAAGAIVRDAPF